MESHLIFSLWIIVFRIPSWIPQHPPILLNVEIFTNNIEVYNNSFEESHESIYYEFVKVENIGLDKRDYKTESS